MTQFRMLLAAVFGLTLAVVGPAPAMAEEGLENCGYSGCTGGGGGNGTGGGGTRSSGTIREDYTSTGQRCSVFANGTGMGAYCLRLGGGNVKSLRERFRGMVFDKCRYREIPDGIPAPFNASPDKGRYMLQLCLQRIDFDTYSGGSDRGILTDIVWINWGVNIEDIDNPLNEFVWTNIERVQQLPAPFMITRPNPTPIVGVPTFFTFRWLDPGDRSVVRDQAGPYSQNPNGGPYKRIETASGLVMVAEATEIRIDPRQKGMEPVTCDPSTPYLEGKPASAQPANACKLVFDRSSAQAQELRTGPMPPGLKDSFYAMVEVDWHVTYGRPGEMRELGDGFTMRVAQGIRVQEVQAPNQPPIVIY